MKFIENIKKCEYDEFVLNSKMSHFLQSYLWGQFSKESRNLIPHYVGVVDEKNKLIATAMLLQKKLPFGYSYFYSPRGMIVDYTDKELLEFFIHEIKEYSRKFNVIFLKIDPNILWNVQDNDGNNIDLDFDKNKIFYNICSVGFKHLGFTKNFETSQPRYSFRIDMNQSLEEIESKFSKTTKQRIKKACDFDVETRIGNVNDIPLFFDLMRLTEDRKNFISHDLNYYKKLYEIYNDGDIYQFILFIGSVNLENIILDYKKQLEEFEKDLLQLSYENLSKSKNTLKKELTKKKNDINMKISEYSEYKLKYGNIVDLNAHAIIKFGQNAWVLYAGNHNILNKTYSNYKVYDEHIKYCYDNGVKMYDQFGTIGDLSKDNPRLGLHEFKRKFGGDYVEFIGEFDLVFRPFLYFVFIKLVPFYRKFLRWFTKKSKK